MHDRTAIDHFLDPLEYNKLEDALGPAERQPEFTKDRIDAIRLLMEPLTFPWDTGHGMMVGYGGTEEIDSFFIEAISKSAELWRSQAGIHPDVVIGATRGSVLAAIVLLLGSFYLKHIHFVDIGARLNPATNYAMALTIWKPPDEMTLSIAEFTQIPATRVRGAIEALAVTKYHADFFAAEQKPYIPMLLRFSDDHYVSPISSIFHNPLEGVRLLGGHYSPAFEQELLRHREAWMIDELRHIFLGTRYAQTTGPTRLRRSGAILTDIDWAILDVTTGELALFQLKWQDFMTSGVRKQRSRAQNFGTQVEAWRSKVESWIAEFGIGQLLRALHLPAQRTTAVRILLFAIGRSNARFASFGVAQPGPSIALATWPQFVRLRHQIGPAASVLGELHSKLLSELSYPIERQPLRHEILIRGQRVIFEDIWNGFGAEDVEDK